ncbi:MAG: 23S rRNA (adenine(2503)-C(2))-methyltransferase RlmN [Coriobacteriaceae bacterium]|nr:23S rRNA (adenine(2503)-C(2))-methyltransferase RlmN [Coriobacteriaceae bacterium]
MSDAGREDIKALGREELGRALSGLGQPAYRTGQILAWLHARGVRSFDEMTDLPAALRAELAGRFDVNVPSLAECQVSRDGTRKYLWRLADGVTVESVGLPESDRLTVCFSTQAGCAMGCAFCATGRGGLVRDLVAGEMVDQVRLVAEDLGVRATGAVAMGQGEPFANYDATLAALRLMNSPDGLGIGARHLTVSTCGLPERIRAFASEPEQFTLAISLHSAVQATRDSLMPGVAGIPLGDLRRAVADYADRTGRRPTFEYALVGGVNDSAGELRALVAFCSGSLCHVNLIPANPVEGSGLRRAPADRGRVFAEALARAGVETSLRRERGADIDAACGQLRQRSG